jgi:hypothetical protein
MQGISHQGPLFSYFADCGFGRNAACTGDLPQCVPKMPEYGPVMRKVYIPYCFPNEIAAFSCW